MRGWILGLTIVLGACGGGGDDTSEVDGGAGGSGGGGGGGESVQPIDGEGRTAAYAQAYDQIQAVAATASSTDDIGDPSPFVNSEAETPSEPSQLSSLYYESGDFSTRIEAVRDRRPGVQRNDNAGKKIAADVAKALQIGAVAAVPMGRNSPRWYALQAARRLDEYFVLAAWNGLSERSAAGYDRALSTLFDTSGTPHGLGALIQAGDTACGTDHLDQIKQLLISVHDPLKTAIAEFGLPDSLDRLVITEGQSPEYDAAMEPILEQIEAGLATVFLASLSVEPFDAAGQAALQASSQAFAARLQELSPETRDLMSVEFDRESPGDVDRAAVAAAFADALEVAPCAL